MRVWGSHSLPSSGGKVFLYLLSGIMLTWVPESIFTVRCFVLVLVTTKILITNILHLALVSDEARCRMLPLHLMYAQSVGYLLWDSHFGVSQAVS